MLKMTTLWSGLCVGLSLSVATVTSSQAQSIEDTVGFSWTGLYAGLSVGASRMTTVDRDVGNEAGVRWFAGAADTVETGSSEGIAGLHIGADYDFGGWVMGITGDINASSFDQSVDVFGLIGTTELEWMTTLRARFGVSVPDAPVPVLIYGTGGAAFARLHTSISDTETVVTLGLLAANPSSDLVTGYTVGGGLEAAATDNLSIGLEYMYTDLGTYDIIGTCVACGVSPVGTPQPFEEELNFHTLRAKISWRFGG